jgi:hypothetical protein
MAPGRRWRFLGSPAYRKFSPHCYWRAYLLNGGKLEHAQHMAAHESSRTTGLYDRRKDEVTLDEVERIILT